MKTDLFAFLDYRGFLKAAFAERRASNPRFTRAHFALLADMKTPYYLSLVIGGHRNLAPESAAKFARALDLTEKETAYFETLVWFNQAKSDRDREMYFDRLLRLRPKSHAQELDRDHFEYFTRRHFVTIREMVALKEFREDYEWIGSRLSPQVKAGEAEHAVAVLLKLGLLKRDAKGALKHTRKTLTYYPDLSSVEAYDYTRQMLTEAKQTLLSEAGDWVDMVSVTVPMSKSRLPEIRMALQKCKDEVIRIIGQDSSRFDEVFQLNLQYYPITKSCPRKRSTGTAA